MDALAVVRFGWKYCCCSQVLAGDTVDVVRF